jgi:hypothetical protein
MGFDERAINDNIIKTNWKKHSESFLLLADNNELYIPCHDSLACTDMQHFFKTGEIVNKLSISYFKKYFEEIKTIDRSNLEAVESKYDLILYPQIVDYSYTIDIEKIIVLTIGLNMNVKIQAFNNEKKIIFEKIYSIKDTRSESFQMGFKKLVYLEQIFYKSLFQVFIMAQEDIDKIILKDTHENK